MLSLGLVLGLALVASEAGASTYRVYTSSAASSMTVNASDGQCTLAEAVLHVNGANNNVTYCDDFAPGSAEHRIELLQAANRPYATNHFQITTLTITSSKRVSIPGLGAFIDSTGRYSAFVIGTKDAPQPQPTVFFERLTLTNTAGSAGGRLVENYGTLQLYAVTITKGDATGSHHSTGRGGGIFNAGTIGFAENSVISNNKARRGGGLYNDSGVVNQLAVVISGNVATLAGGGIYNMSTSPGPELPTNGRIVTFGLRLEGNSARTGGGVFNRGLVELTGSTVTGNFTAGTLDSGETCLVSVGVDQPPGTISCNDSGGGVLSVHQPGGAVTRFQLSEGSLSNNTASSRGGGVYAAGVLEMGGNHVDGNRAQNGAALYVVGPADGTQQYCNIYGNNLVGTATINGNTATSSSGYSIVAGGSLDMRTCTFPGLVPPAPPPAYLTATGNSTPRVCKPGTVDLVNSRCPQ
jgi:predicted outer membrane repeat protein